MFNNQKCINCFRLNNVKEHKYHQGLQLQIQVYEPCQLVSQIIKMQVCSRDLQIPFRKNF